MMYLRWFVAVFIICMAAPGEGSSVTATLEEIRRQPDDDDGLYTGSVVTLNFTVDFTDQSEPTDTTITLNDYDWQTRYPVYLAYSRTIAIMTGAALNVDRPDWAAKDRTGWSDKENVLFPTRVYFNLGNVSRMSAMRDVSLLDLLKAEGSVISIVYELVCIAQNETKKGQLMQTNVSVNTGDHYQYVFLNFTFLGIKTVDKEPSISVENVTEIEVLKPVSIGLSLFLPYTTSNVEVSVDVSRKNNATSDVYQGMIVQEINVLKAGSAFNYSLFPRIVRLVGYNTCPLKSSLSLIMAPLVNRESLLEVSDPANSVIRLGITVLLSDPTINNTNVSVRVGVAVDDIIVWESVLNLTVVKRAVNAELNQMINGIIVEQGQGHLRSETPDHLNVSSSSISHALVALETPPRTNQTYMLTLSFYSNSTRKSLNVLKVTPVFYGSNLVCQNVSAELREAVTTEDDLHHWQHIHIHAHVFNIGVYENDIANILKLNVSMLIIGTAAVGDQYRMVAGLGHSNFNESQVPMATEPTSGSLINVTTLTVVAMTKVSFELQNTDVVVPAIANIVIHTPPGSNLTYNISLKTYVYSANLFPRAFMKILTVNLVYLGSNLLDGVLSSDATLRVSSSLNNSVQDVAEMEFLAINVGTSDEPNANDIVLEVVLLVPSDVYMYIYNHHLQADVNNAGEQLTWFTPVFNLEYNRSLAAADMLRPCETNAYCDGMQAVFQINIITHNDSTYGPMKILIPWNDHYSFVNASVAYKGRNVVCVSPGPIETTTDNMSEHSVLDLPMVCSGKRGTSTEDNSFVIEVVVIINELPFDHPNKRKEAEFSAIIPDVYTVSYTFRIFPPINLTELVRLSNIYVYKKYVPVDSVRLQWGLDRRNLVDVEVTLKEENANMEEMWMVIPDKLVIAQFVRLFTIHDGCHIRIGNYTRHKDIPFLHGPASKTLPLLHSLILYPLHRRSTDECMPLPSSGNPETTPYLWVDMKLSLFGIKRSSKFTVHLVGHGLQCNARAGPQITLVVFEKQNSEFEGENEHRMCEFDDVSSSEFDDVSSSESGSCSYSCACREKTEECRAFTLVMMHTGTSVDHYSLCDIHVEQEMLAA